MGFIASFLHSSQKASPSKTKIMAISNPEISVIIPFHNRIDWTKEAILSVLRQTYENFEIILVDDGSDFNYQTEFEKMDARIRFFRQPNQGPSSARNKGMEHAQGHFFAFLDSDDTFLENKLEIQVGVMQANPSALLSHSSYILMDAYRNEYATMNSGFFAGWVYPAIFTNCPIATPTVMLRKDAFQLAKFDEDIHIAEDILMWSKIAKNNMIVGIHQPLSQVRNHGNNASLDYDKQLTGLFNIINYGIKADVDIKGHVKKVLLSEIYWNVAFFLFKKKHYVNAFTYSSVAITYAFLTNNIEFLKGKALPIMLKYWARFKNGE